MVIHDDWMILGAPILGNLILSHPVSSYPVFAQLSTCWSATKSALKESWLISHDAASCDRWVWLVTLSMVQPWAPKSARFPKSFQRSWKSEGWILKDQKFTTFPKVHIQVWPISILWSWSSAEFYSTNCSQKSIKIHRMNLHRCCALWFWSCSSCPASATALRRWRLRPCRPSAKLFRAMSPRCRSRRPKASW